MWRHHSEPGVATNNDCGSVAYVSGGPLLRRSFMSAEEPGLSLYIADRVHSGDELVVPAGSLLEVHSGTNVAVVLGPGSGVRLDGLRSYPLGDGRSASRLDLTVLHGEVRIQVRLNEESPEAALAGVDGAEVLVTRGDVAVLGGGAWRAVAVSGNAEARILRGTVRGAAFAFDGAVGLEGREEPSADELAALRVRLPFSFESIRAALPPLPAASRYLEAP